jgi:hypothetical protein
MIGLKLFTFKDHRWLMSLLACLAGSPILRQGDYSPQEALYHSELGVRYTPSGYKEDLHPPRDLKVPRHSFTYQISNTLLLHQSFWTYPFFT